MIMGTVESDWLKEAKCPEMYEQSLEALEEAKADG